MKRLILLFTLLFTVTFGFSSVYVTVGSGNWDNSDVWVNVATGKNGVPGSQDTAIIDSGKIVQIEDFDTVYYYLFTVVYKYPATEEVNTLIIKNGGKLTIYSPASRNPNNLSKLYVYNKLIVDGSLEGDVGDAGSTVYVGFYLEFYGDTIGGTGLIRYGQVDFNTPKTVFPKGTDLTFSWFLLNIPQNDTVWNSGSITTDRRIIGNGASSVWVNDTDAYLSVADSMLHLGTLVANAPGNTIEYNTLYQWIPVKESVDTTYWNLVISGYDTTYLANNFLIKGDLKLSSGALKAYGHRLWLLGDWLDYGSYIYDSSGVYFVGTKSQHIIAPSSVDFHKVIFNNTDTIILGASVNVMDTLVMNCVVQNAGNVLTLGSSETGPGYLDYVSGKCLGEFRRWIVGSATPYVYPIGTSDYNTFVTVKFPTIASSGLVGFKFVNDFPGNSGLPLKDYTGLTVYNTFGDGYWVSDTLDGFKLGSGNTYDISLQGDGFTAFTIGDSTRILIRPSADSTWRFNGKVGTNDPTTYTVSRVSLDSFPRQFVFADTTNCSPPVLHGIQGPQQVCRGSTGLVYTTDTSSTNTFYWTVPGGEIVKNGGDTITVNWADSGFVSTISVYAANKCSFGNTVTYTVYVNSIPPKQLYGLHAVPEESDSLLYYIERRDNYSYTWKIKAGDAVVDSVTPLQDSAYISFGAPGNDTLMIIAADSSGCEADTAYFPIYVYEVITSVTSGEFGDPSTWDCNCEPLPNDNVRIAPGDVVTVDQYYNGKLTETFYDINNVEVKPGAVLKNTDAALNIYGDLINNGEMDFDQLTLMNNNNQIAGSGIMNIDTIFIEGTRIINSLANLLLNGSFQLHGNYIDNQGRIVVTHDIKNGTWKNDYKAYLRINGSLFPVNGTLLPDTTGNTVYLAGGTQDITVPDITTNGYYNLILGGSGTKTATGDINVLGSFIITDTATFDLAGHTITIYSNWIDTSAAATPFLANGGTVLFNSDTTQYFIVKKPETLYDLHIGQYATLVLTPGQALTVTDIPYIDGTMLLQFKKVHDTLPSFIYDNDISFGTNGKIISQLFMNAKQYHEIAVSMQGIKSSFFTKSIPTTYNPNLYWYDETVDLDGDPSTEPSPFDASLLAKGWTEVQPTDTSPDVELKMNCGYLFYTDRDQIFNLTGQPASVNVDYDTLNLSYTDNDPNTDGDTLPNLYDGWHILGNPYLAYLSIDSILNNATNVDNGVYVWDDDNGEYAGYQNGYRILSGNLGPYIPPLQGFAIRANAAGAAVKIRAKYRVNAQQMYLKKSSDNAKYAKFHRNAIKLRLYANGKVDNFVTYFYKDATVGYDSKYDMVHLSPQLTKFPDVPRLYAVVPGGAQLALNALPDSLLGKAVVHLNVQVGKSGHYYITVPYIKGLENDFVILHDLKTGQYIWLHNGTRYDFDYQVTDQPHRFDLLIVQDHQPQIVSQIGKAVAYEDSMFTLDLSKYFKDIDRFDKLSYNLSVTSGKYPKFLSIDGNKLIGKPAQKDVGLYHLKLTACDIFGERVSQNFYLEVLNTNDPPQVMNKLQDVEIYANDKFQEQIPSSTFYDPDPGDKLTISANNLPDWLHYNPQNQTLEGVPGVNDVGVYKIKITATDLSGASAYTTQKITVLAKPQLQNKAYNVYPNPAVDKLNVILAKPKPGTKIRLISMDGQIVLQKALEGDHITLDVSDLQNGTYILEIITPDRIYKTMVTKN